MPRRYKLSVTLTFDAPNLALAHAIAAQGKSIVIAEWSKHQTKSELAAIMQEIRPAVQWDGPEEVLS